MQKNEISPQSLPCDKGHMDEDNSKLYVLIQGPHGSIILHSARSWTCTFLKKNFRHSAIQPKSVISSVFSELDDTYMAREVCRRYERRLCLVCCETWTLRWREHCYFDRGSLMTPVNHSNASTCTVILVVQLQPFGVGLVVRLPAGALSSQL